MTAGTLSEDLPLPQRLALSYAPRAARQMTLTFLLLDHRMADILRGASEPLIAQMKLAWWRDRLGEDRMNWPQGEPLLASLQEWTGETAALVPLVDGWERLLAEDFGPLEAAAFAQGRAQGWAALAEGLGVTGPSDRIRQAGREWALHDLLLHISAESDSAALQEIVAAEPWDVARLPRALRSLAVLHALSKRALLRREGELLAGPGAMLRAIRVGLFGQ